MKWWAIFSGNPMWIPVVLCDCAVNIWMQIKITSSLLVSKVRRRDIFFFLSALILEISYPFSSKPLKVPLMFSSVLYPQRFTRSHPAKGCAEGCLTQSFDVINHRIKGSLWFQVKYIFPTPKHISFCFRTASNW